MPLPIPHPGLVIGYRYLWHAKARSGRVAGHKDRPCVVVLAVQEENGETAVTVVPVTHSPLQASAEPGEVPLRIKQRLGLDGEPSWVIVTEVNRFVWPGPGCGRSPAIGRTVSTTVFSPSACSTRSGNGCWC